METVSLHSSCNSRPKVCFSYWPSEREKWPVRCYVWWKTYRNVGDDWLRALYRLTDEDKNRGWWYCTGKNRSFFALQWDASRFVLDLEIDINPNYEYFKIWKVMDRTRIVLLLPTEYSKALNLLCLQWMEMHNFHIAL